MSDIILLTALADADRVTPIIDALVEERLDARWVPVGAPGSIAEADAAIAAARCVLIAWSERTAAPDAAEFQALVRRAIAERKAVAVRVEDVQPPAGLDTPTLYDLSGWRGRPARWRQWLGGSLYMRDVVAAAKYKVAGRDPAPPSAPRAMLVRQLLATIPAVFALIALVPTVFGFWRDLGLVSAEESKAWAAVDPASCAAVRGFLARYPDGSLAGQAQARLDARTIATEEWWQDEERTLPLFVGSGLAAAAPSRAAAEADLARRAGETATSACRGLAEAGHARFVRYRLAPGGQSCTTTGDGVRCGFDGSVTCRQQEPRSVEVERCPSPSPP